MNNSRDPFEDIIAHMFGDFFRPFNGFYIDDDRREINPFELFSRDPFFSDHGFARSGHFEPGIDDIGGGDRIQLEDESPDTREGSGSVFDRVRNRILEIFENDRNQSSNSSPQWDIQPLPGSRNPGGFRPWLPNDEGSEVEAPRTRTFFKSYSSRTTVGANGVRETITTVTDQDGNTETTRTVDGDPGTGSPELWNDSGEVFDNYGGDTFPNQSPFSDQGLHGFFGNLFGGLFGRDEHPSSDYFGSDNQMGNNSPFSSTPFRRSEPDISSLYVDDPQH